MVAAGHARLGPERWFRTAGNELVLDESIRAMATFEHGNLAEQATGLAAPGSLDVVFCRNVFIYFSPEAIRSAVERFARALQPGGYLFLGDAESLRGISTAFELCHSHETFYYRLRSERVRRSIPAGRTPPAPSAGVIAAPEERPPDPPEDGVWMETIGRASRRVASLGRGAARARSATPAPPPESWDLEPIRKLVTADREAEALAAVAALPPRAQADPEVKLLSAALLTNRGDLAGAERICRDLLAIDEFNAGAHYLLALGCEQRSELADALEHDRIAAYLDPDFAMPRLHFGRLARRLGASQRARQELAARSSCWTGRTPLAWRCSAGGFSREGLRQICRTELAACGGDR